MARPGSSRSGRAPRGGDADASISGARARRGREPTLADEIEASGETPKDESVDEAKDDLQFLAREFLTWLVFHAEVGGGHFDLPGKDPGFQIAFGGKLTLRSPAGLVTDVTMKGPSPVGSADLRYALAGGLAVKEADLRLEHGERVYTFGLAAEHLDLKRVKLPELLTEEDDDRADERLDLLATLEAHLRSAFARFVELRLKPAWTKNTVPAIRDWLDEGIRT